MGENTFKVGDYVEVITKRSEDFGLKGYIQRIEGHMYKVANSYWYVWQELDYAEAPSEPEAPQRGVAGAGDDMLPAPDLSTERLLRMGVEAADKVIALQIELSLAQERIATLEAALAPFVMTRNTHKLFQQDGGKWDLGKFIDENYSGKIIEAWFERAHKAAKQAPSATGDQAAK